MREGVAHIVRSGIHNSRVSVKLKVVMNIRCFLIQLLIIPLSSANGWAISSSSKPAGEVELSNAELCRGIESEGLDYRYILPGSFDCKYGTTKIVLDAEDGNCYRYECIDPWGSNGPCSFTAFVLTQSLPSEACDALR